MKKTFTILIAAIAAILMMAQPMKVMGQTYEELYSANFTSLSAFSYTQNKEFTLSNKTWIASTCQLNSNVFYLGCSSSTVAYGVLNNNTSFSNEVAALKSADSQYSSNNNYTTAHAYAMRFDNSYSNVTKVEFTWSGGNNAFQVYLFGDSGSGYVKLASTNYATSGASTSGSVTWTGDATNFTKFAIVARPGTTSTIITTQKSLRAATFKIYKTQSSTSVTAPTINPTAVTTFEDELEVSLTVAQGTTAYYNINSNTDPTSESTPYTAPFNISASSTIKAIAYDGSSNPSSVVTKTYTKEEFSNIEDVDTDKAYKVRGTVVATNTRGFMLADNTGYVYVYLYHGTYNTNPTIPNINDKRKVNGTPGTYGKVIEYKYGCTVTEATGTTFTSDTPNVIDGNDMYGVIQDSENNYLSAFEQFEGTLSYSDDKYTISVAGDEHNATAQISYPNSTQTEALDALVGKTVRVQGYFTGLSSGYYTVMLGSIEEVTSADPSIFIANASLQLEYPANQNGSFTVEYTNFEPAAATAVLYTDENCTVAFPTYGDGAWIILDDGDLAYPYTSIPFKVSANTGNNARSVYMKVEAMDAELEVVDAVFQINQAKQPQYTISYAAGAGTGTMTDNNLYHQGDVVTLQANSFTAPADKIWGSWSAKDSENNDVTVSNGQITMPASNVTVTAQWINDPNAPTYAWVETSFSDLTSNDIFVIVGTRTDDTYGGSYALPNNDGTSNPSAESITITNNKLASSPANEYKWNISGNATDGYTFYPNGDDKNWLYCTNNNQGVRVGTGNNKLFKFIDGGTVGDVQQAYYIYNTGQSRYVGLYNAQDWRCYTSINDNIKNQSFKFYKRVLAKEITGVDNGDGGGYYLISSPIASLTPTKENGFLRDDNQYDLYCFDQSQEAEWQNYKQNHTNFTSIESGKGYLYANKSNTTLLFNGEAYDGDGSVALSFTSNAEFEGWNLIGNPLSTNATIDKASFYRMNAGGTDVISASGTVNVMEGIFVYASTENQTVTFTEDTGDKRSDDSQIVLNVIGNNDNLIDRAVVRFNENDVLPKFMLDESNTKIYLPQDGSRYAVVSSEGKGTMPVNFKAKQMGKYTISVNTEGIDMDYLHLIDRLTGEDVNLLLDNSYSFIATKQDMESRFILSFTATGYNQDADEPFAFQNGSDIIVNGTGELQIFDLMGRMVSTQNVNGIETINVKSQGVYIFRLNEKTQKIVVR